MTLKLVAFEGLRTIFKRPKPAPSVLPVPLKLKDGYLSSKKECRVMAALCAWQNPKKVFEFGTFEGFTTLLLAMNSSNTTKIFTLDFSHDNRKKSFYPLNQANLKYVHTRKKILFNSTPLARKICQVFGDSALLETRPFKQKIDLIFIDGAHTYAYTKNDTEKAFEMLRKNGLIVWHDYNPGYWPETTHFLDELSTTKKLFHIKDTFLAVYKNDI